MTGLVAEGSSATLSCAYRVSNTCRTRSSRSSARRCARSSTGSSARISARSSERSSEPSGSNENCVSCGQSEPSEFFTN